MSRVSDLIAIIDKIEAIAKKAQSNAEYRAMLAEAAQRGDLDVSSDAFEDANADAEAFIQGGE